MRVFSMIEILNFGALAKLTDGTAQCKELAALVVRHTEGNGNRVRTYARDI